MSAGDVQDKAFLIEEVTADSDPPLVAQARELLLEYGRFVVARPGVARFCFGTLEKEAERLPQSYIEVGGGSLVARANGKAAGFVAWRAVPETVSRDAWELKRLWVRSEGRGLGLGRTLTQGVLDRARVARRTAVYLDTVPGAMTAAHQLYLDMGFVPCAAYNDNPVDGLAYLVKYL